MMLEFVQCSIKWCSTHHYKSIFLVGKIKNRAILNRLFRFGELYEVEEAKKNGSKILLKLFLASVRNLKQDGDDGKLFENKMFTY